jgi:tetratricopeptide (TPR) repeat protein
MAKMSDCIDKKYQRLIHLYELDLLSDHDKEQFELHMMHCDACFEEIEEFKKASDHLVFSNSVRDTIRSISDSESKTAERAKAIKLRFSRRLIPITVTVAIILFLLILKPWYIEISPEREAVAAENRIAIMYFENLAAKSDEDRLGEIITNLLITDLTEFENLQVISSQQLHDLFRLYSRDDKKTNKDIAAQIADRANARWVLLGNILQTELSYVITAELIDMTSGDVTATEYITGDSTDNIFTLVDRLTVAIEKDLTILNEPLKGPDRNIADVTTHSVEAYRYFMIGKDFYHKLYYDDAIDSFKMAVSLDTTFAMAHYYLGLLGRDEYTSRAMQYIDRVTIREQYYIRWLAAEDMEQKSGLLKELLERYPNEKSALLTLGNYARQTNDLESAIDYFNRAIEVDQLYKNAYNDICYTYCELNDISMAIWAVTKYISLAPDEANPHDTQGDVYAYFGEVDRAIESYRQAIKIKPDYLSSIIKLANLYTSVGEFYLADSIYQYTKDGFGPKRRINAIFDLTNIPLGKGKFNDALITFDSALVFEKLDLSKPDEANFISRLHARKGLVYFHSQKYDQATAELEKAQEIYTQYIGYLNIDYLRIIIDVTAARGKYDHAETLAEEIKHELGKTGEPLHHYKSALAYISLQKGEYENAIGLYENITQETTLLRDFLSYYRLAVAYTRGGNYDRAVSLFNRLTSCYTNLRTREIVRSAKMHYYLGIAYEESQWFEMAIEQYEYFISIWQEADIDLPEVINAKERLNRLENRS